MSNTPPTLNGIPALTVRLNIPWRGVWSAEVTLDAPEAAGAQTLAAVATPVTLIVGGTTLLGVIDPKGSATFDRTTTVRVVGGRGGWSKTVPAKHFNMSAGGLTTATVLSVTATEVLESVVDAAPKLLGVHYARAKGPASDVFAGRQWFVNPTTGVTLVADWPIGVLASDGLIQAFEPYEQRVTVGTDGSIVLPGTRLIDPRFNGATYTVRDVEQIFSATETVAHCHCAQVATSRLWDAFQTAAQAAADTGYLKTYRYRFAVAGPAGKLVLQAVTAGAPDLNPIEQWSGLSGSVDVHAPGTEIVVGFAEGDPSHPYVVAYAPTAVPLQIALAATVSFGVTAPIVSIGATGGTPVFLAKGPVVDALITALHTFATAAKGSADPVLAPAALALETAIVALATVQTTSLKGS